MKGEGRKPPKTERNRDVYRMVEDGIPYRRIGKHFGISHERVRQVYHREAAIVRAELERRQIAMSLLNPSTQL